MMGCPEVPCRNAIDLAGSVRARRNSRNAISDRVAMERERGDSISSIVLQFPYSAACVKALKSAETLGGAPQRRIRREAIMLLHEAQKGAGAGLVGEARALAALTEVELVEEGGYGTFKRGGGGLLLGYLTRHERQHFSAD